MPPVIEPAAAHVFVADLERLELEDPDGHHLARSLRLRPGEVVTASDGAGAWEGVPVRRRAGAGA
jgi:hypothetical protein